MFKNAFIYRLLTQLDSDDIAPLQDSLSALVFTPCAPSQEKSMGWVPPRGREHGPLLEVVGGQWILKLMTETKVVPASVIKARTELWKAETERQTGRKPGKKETRHQQDDIRMALLPMAFPKQSATLIWIDPIANLIVVDASTQSKADDAMTGLVHAIEGLAVQMIQTNISPASAMAQCLVEQEAPAGFTVDRECELKACDESKAVVRYSRHALDLDEVADHIRMGKMPTRLAMTYDGRVSFVLIEGLTLKKIEILDVVVDEHFGGDLLADASFDADVTIATGELAKLLPALFGALGGEVQS